MGLGDFFRRRKERESALPPSATDTQALGSFASSEDQPVVGQQVGGIAGAGFTGMPANLTDLPGLLESAQSLAALGPMIQQAMAQGNVQQDTPQSIDLRGTGLREEILGIMKQHGLDPENMSGQQVDASAMPAMQQQILEALGKYGVDAGASGPDPQFGVSEDEGK